MAFNWIKFPWTNLHDLNLDWIIQTVKQLENKVAELGVKVANAASVGYVKQAVAAVDGKLDTEITNRTSGDAALQSTIDKVIMPLLNARGIRDFHVTGIVGQDGELTSVSFDSENPKSELDDLLARSTKVRLVVALPDETRYFSMCYNTATDYGFSGMYRAPSSNTAIHELIIYNGTTFVVLWQ